MFASYADQCIIPWELIIITYVASHVQHCGNPYLETSCRRQFLDSVARSPGRNHRYRLLYIYIYDRNGTLVTRLLVVGHIRECRFSSYCTNDNRTISDANNRNASRLERGLPLNSTLVTLTQCSIAAAASSSKQARRRARAKLPSGRYTTGLELLWDTATTWQTVDSSFVHGLCGITTICNNYTEGARGGGLQGSDELCC